MDRNCQIRRDKLRRFTAKVIQNLSMLSDFILANFCMLIGFIKRIIILLF